MGFQNLSIDEIAKILRLQKSSGGEYDCPKFKNHPNGDYRNSLVIRGKNFFSKNKCGLIDLGWDDLTAQLFQISRRAAQVWLNSRC